MNLPKGTLKKLESITGIASQRLCDYAATRVRPRPGRAVELENACEKIGLNCPAATWLLGSSHEIKQQLKAQSFHEPTEEPGAEDRRRNQFDRRHKDRRRFYDRRHD